MATVVWVTTSCQTKLRGVQTRVFAALPNIVGITRQRVVKETSLKVPIKTGKLMLSGLKEGSIGKFGAAGQAEIKYSATNPRNGYNYAAIQHEVPFNHPFGGEDHFLFKSLHENAGMVIETWAMETSRIIG